MRRRKIKRKGQHYFTFLLFFLLSHIYLYHVLVLIFLLFPSFFVPSFSILCLLLSFLSHFFVLSRSFIAVFSFDTGSHLIHTFSFSSLTSLFFFSSSHSPFLFLVATFSLSFLCPLSRFLRCLSHPRSNASLCVSVLGLYLL